MPERLTKSKAAKPSKKAERNKQDKEKDRDKDCQDPTKAAEAAYIESLVVTGQAAKPDAKGRLPAGATHEIETTTTGEVKVTRRRFSIY